MGNSKRNVQGPAIERRDLNWYANEVVRIGETEAARGLEGALLVLSSAGLYGEDIKPRPIPLNFLLKLAACVRICEWENAGLWQQLKDGLPTSAEVWDDLLNAPRTGRERFPARDLVGQVFGVRLKQMAWRPPTPKSDVVLNSLNVPRLADELAQLLFDFRHLADDGPAEPEEQ